MRYFILIFVLFGIGCASAPEKMSGLRVGMTKEEALNVMGSPDQTAANTRAEALFYRKGWDWYYVNLVDGKVESYGQKPVSESEMANRRAAAAFMMAHPAQVQPVQQPVYQMPVRRPVNCMTNQVGSTAFTNCQ
jgi:hypothetical protein